jgi:hypothetical protein
MFDHHHRYVPVLLWKKGEQDAVRHLAHEDKRRMTPLLEIPASRPLPRENAKRPKRPQIKGDWLTETADTVWFSWGPILPVFVELKVLPTAELLAIGLSHQTERLFGAARHRDLKWVPVVRLTYGPSRQAAIRRVVAADRRGICIRLTRLDLVRPTLHADLEALLKSLRTTPEDADLVLDLHIVGEAGFDLMVACAQLPLLDRWRSFTVVGGAFPSGLAKLERGTNWIERWEWRMWSNQVRRDLPRRPAYGDYTTLHPVPFDPARHPNPCANIRYTTERHWIVMKGQQLVPREEQPSDPRRHEQFPAMACLLEDMRDQNKQPYYKSESFSFGDEYIHKMANKFREGQASGRGNTGSTTTWLTAGVNHHLTYAVIQIANLIASSNSPGHGNVAGPAAQPPQGEHREPLAVARPNPVLHGVAPTE